MPFRTHRITKQTINEMRVKQMTEPCFADGGKECYKTVHDELLNEQSVTATGTPWVEQLTKAFQKSGDLRCALEDG